MLLIIFLLSAGLALGQTYTAPQYLKWGGGTWADGDCLKLDNKKRAISAGAACGTGSGGSSSDTATNLGAGTFSWFKAKASGAFQFKTGATTAPIVNATANDVVTISCPTCLVNDGSYTDPSWLNVSWTKIGSKPATFTPSSHSHVIADVTSLQTGLNNKQDVNAVLTQLSNLPCADGESHLKASGVWTCAVISGSGNLSGYYVGIVSSNATWTIAGSTHNLATCDLARAVYEVSGGNQTEIEPNSFVCNQTSKDVTITFSSATAGRIVLIKGGAGSGGGSGDTTSVANTGAGAKVLKETTNVTGRTLVAGSGITITENTDTITFVVTGGSGGQENIGAGLERVNNVLQVAQATVPSKQSFTGSLDFPNMAQNECQERTITVTGALPSDIVAPGWPHTLDAGFTGTMFVSASNTVTVRLCKHTTGSADPVEKNFNGMLLKSF